MSFCRRLNPVRSNPETAPIVVISTFDVFRQRHADSTATGNDSRAGFQKPHHNVLHDRKHMLAEEIVADKLRRQDVRRSAEVGHIDGAGDLRYSPTISAQPFAAMMWRAMLRQGLASQVMASAAPARGGHHGEKPSAGADLEHLCILETRPHEVPPRSIVSGAVADDAEVPVGRVGAQRPSRFGFAFRRSRTAARYAREQSSAAFCLSPAACICSARETIASGRPCRRAAMRHPHGAFGHRWLRWDSGSRALRPTKRETVVRSPSSPRGRTTRMAASTTPIATICRAAARA